MAVSILFLLENGMINKKVCIVGAVNMPRKGISGRGWSLVLDEKQPIFYLLVLMHYSQFVSVDSK